MPPFNSRLKCLVLGSTPGFVELGSQASLNIYTPMLGKIGGRVRQSLLCIKVTHRCLRSFSWKPYVFPAGEEAKEAMCSLWKLAGLSVK